MFSSRPDEFAPTSFVGSDDWALARGIVPVRPSPGGRLGRHAGGPSRRHHNGAARRRIPRRCGRARQHSDREHTRRLLSAREWPHMRELLAVEPRIDGVLAANDFMALEALDAMHEAERPIPIVGVNATPEGVAVIKAGDLLGLSLVRYHENGVPGGGDCPAHCAARRCRRARLVGAPGNSRTRSRPRWSSILSHRIIFYCDAQHRWAICRHPRRLKRRCLENERCLGRAG